MKAGILILCWLLPFFSAAQVVPVPAVPVEVPTEEQIDADNERYDEDDTPQDVEEDKNLEKESVKDQDKYQYRPFRYISFSLIGSHIEQTSTTVASSKEDVFKVKRLSGPSQYDSRIEIAQLRADIPWQLSIRMISESVAMVVERQNLIKISPTAYQLNTAVTLGSRYNLCEGQAFSNQLVVGVGTAFLVDKKTLITAAHVFQRPLKDYAIVFGYRVINSLGTAETSIAAADVYFPVQIEKTFADLDVVKFKADREINRPVLAWERSDSLKNRAEIYMLGYPMGLPEKLAINADISDNSNFQYFYTSLDSFQGNSGSPVFDYQTHKVIGILVSGMTDYELRGDCYQSTLCKQPDCIGEKAIRIEMVFDP